MAMLGSSGGESGQPLSHGAGGPPNGSRGAIGDEAGNNGGIATSATSAGGGGGGTGWIFYYGATITPPTTPISPPATAGP